MDPDAAQQEYWDLFVGTGKSEVDLHASHWLAGLHDGEAAGRACATSSRALGLARKPDSAILEDHLSALFETMRLLIEGDGERRRRR